MCGSTCEDAFRLLSCENRGSLSVWWAQLTSAESSRSVTAAPLHQLLISERNKVWVYPCVGWVFNVSVTPRWLGGITTPKQGHSHLSRVHFFSLRFSPHLSEGNKQRKMNILFQVAKVIEQNVSLFSHLSLSVVLSVSNCSNSHPICLPRMKKVHNWAVFTGGG